MNVLVAAAFATLAITAQAGTLHWGWYEPMTLAEKTACLATLEHLKQHPPLAVDGKLFDIKEFHAKAIRVWSGHDEIRSFCEAVVAGRKTELELAATYYKPNKIKIISVEEVRPRFAVGRP